MFRRRPLGAECVVGSVYHSRFQMPISFPRTPLRRQITIAIVPALFTLCVMAASSFVFRGSVQTRQAVEHTRDILETSSGLLQRAVDAETGVRAYIVTDDTLFLQPYNGAQADAHARFARLDSLTGPNPERRQRLAALEAALTERFAMLQTQILIRKTQGFEVAATTLSAGKEKMDSLRRIMAAIDADARDQLVRRDAREQNNRRLTSTVIVVGGLLAVLISLLANRMLARNIMQLNEANAELATQAEQLEEQAAELETQAGELEASATELEAANVELEEQSTELEEQRDVAQIARVNAEQANAAKSRFLSTMSHELRTPLNAVTGYIDLMDAGVHGPVTDLQREDIRRIKRAVSQLTSVINDILNFAKLEAGEVRYSMGSVHMHEALGNASTLMEPQAQAKGVRFEYASCDPSLIAFADRERVQQVVLNLLSNAVKYTEPGGVVRLHCAANDGMVYVTVSDTGRGISGHDMERIFDPFVQLLVSAHSPSDGVGLGLAIGRELARGMGGDITVRSTMGIGSEFQLSLRAL